MKSPKLTRGADGIWDWSITNGKSDWVEDAAQAAQHSLERMQINKGESDSHPNMGMKIIETILKSDKSKAEKEFEIKKTILATPGNKRIRTFKWEQDSGHNLTITGTVETEYGVIDLGETLELL